MFFSTDEESKFGVRTSESKCSNIFTVFFFVVVQNLSVGLLDADVYGPSVPTLMNLSHQPEISKR